MNIILDNIEIEKHIKHINRKQNTERWNKKIKCLEEGFDVLLEYMNTYNLSIENIVVADVFLDDGRSGYYDGNGNVWAYEDGVQKFNLNRKILKTKNK